MVTPAGGKLWRYQYTFEGKMKELCLGKYPGRSLAAVRVLHAKAREIRSRGIDPAAQHKEQKQKRLEEKTADENTKKQAVTTAFNRLINRLLTGGIERKFIQAEIKKRGKRAL